VTVGAPSRNNAELKNGKSSSKNEDSKLPPGEGQNEVQPTNTEGMEVI